MEYYVYAILSSLKDYIYVGLTSNLENRFKQHNTGRENTTRHYSPFYLLYVEICNNRQEARLLEKYLKSGFGKEILYEILNCEGIGIPAYRQAGAHA